MPAFRFHVLTLLMVYGVSGSSSLTGAEPAPQAGSNPQARSAPKTQPPDSTASAVPHRLQVFVLAGQSNMQGAGMIREDPRLNGGQGSLEFLARTRPDSPFARLLQPDGTWTERDDVWIHYLDRKGKLKPGFGARNDRIGPELGFGTVVGDAIDDPVLLIKLAWGGKSLAHDFRPPSAGGSAPGDYYSQLVSRTRDVLNRLGREFPELANRTPQLAGIAWHQGWNDRVNQKFNDEYEANLAHLIRDLRRDLKTPELPFVIAETGMSGYQEKHPRALSLMRAQAAVAAYPEFQGNVDFVETRGFYRPAEESPSRQAYHWNSNAETYYLIGAAMGHSMLKLLNHGKATPDTSSN